MLIVCAGRSRSGSTLMYNLVRLTLKSLFGDEVYGASHRHYDKSNKCKYHIVKIHEYNSYFFSKADAVFSCSRNSVQQKRSIKKFRLVMKGQDISDKELEDFVRHDKARFNKWKTNPNYKKTFRFSSLVHEKEKVIDEICDLLGFSKVSSKAKIIDELNNLKRPSKGFDKESCLTAHHFTSEKNGVVYIVSDLDNKADRFKELKHSVKSLKKMHPDLPVTLFTNKDPGIKAIDDVRIVKLKSVREKQNLLYDSPYNNTLYVDCDTDFVGPIKESFRLMERFDLAATHDLIRKDPKKSKKYPAYAKIPDGFPEFGGGVFLFRKSKEVEEFFSVWRSNFKDWYDLTGEVRDQPSFRVSVWQCKDLKFYVLPPEYNHRTKKYNNIQTRILHQHNLWRK